MFGFPLPIPASTGLPRHLYVPVGAAIGAMVLGLALSPLTGSFVARMLVFYAGTALAYAAMPYARRGDIPLVAAWVVLLSELAPCFAGHLMAPTKVAADILGVLMATGPIYVARLRQVQQGDIRPTGRRAGEAPR